MAALPLPTSVRKHRRVETPVVPVLGPWTDLHSHSVWVLREVARANSASQHGLKADLVGRLSELQCPMREEFERMALAHHDGHGNDQENIDYDAVTEALWRKQDLPIVAAPIHALLVKARTPCPPPVVSKEHLEDELLSHLQDRCELGQMIWKLEARWDIITFRVAMEFLASKGFSLALRLLLGGFLHIYIIGIMRLPMRSR